MASKRDSVRMRGASDLPAPLKAALRELRKYAIAYSGGLDSRFLAHASQLCGCEILVINAQGPHISRHETAWARSWAKSRALALENVYWDPLALSAVAENGADRCYHCKKGLLAVVIAIASERGFTCVCDGGNADDLLTYRPGLAAVRELGIVSPLGGLHKSEIRACAKACGLERAGQPSGACLLTRLAYGLRPDPALLAAIGDCEQAISGLLSRRGHPDAAFRLRLRPAPLLQVPVLALAFEAEISRMATAYGFPNAEIVGTSAVSGFFDKKNGD